MAEAFGYQGLMDTLRPWRIGKFEMMQLLRNRRWEVGPRTHIQGFLLISHLLPEPPQGDDSRKGKRVNGKGIQDSRIHCGLRSIQCFIIRVLVLDDCGKAYNYHLIRGFPGDSAVKNPSAMKETRVQSLGQEDPLEKEMATHFSILVWEIPWIEELAGYSPWGCIRVRPDLATKQQQQQPYYKLLKMPGQCNDLYSPWRESFWL